MPVVSGQAGFPNPTNSLIITSAFPAAYLAFWCLLAVGQPRRIPGILVWPLGTVAERDSRTYLKVHG